MNYILCILFVSLNLTTQSAGNDKLMLTHHYTLTTQLLYSMSVNNPISEKQFKHMSQEQFEAVTEYLNIVQSKPVYTKQYKIVNNLYSTFRHFIKEKCLIVINNYEEADIFSETPFPVILRQMDLALGHVTYFNWKYNTKSYTAGVVWIPKRMVSKLNGNFSSEIPNTKYFKTKCMGLKYFYSIWPGDRNSFDCMVNNFPHYIFSSRSWQCEIQVELFMPDSYLQLGKYTEIFDNLGNMRLHTLPSLRPAVHILMGSKPKIEDYDWVALAVWTLRRNNNFRDNVHDNVNHVQVIAHVDCNARVLHQFENLDCNVEYLNVLFLCPECHKFVNVYPVKPDHLSFDNIAVIENKQKLVAFPGRFSSQTSYLLGASLAHYVSQEPEAIKQPLMNLLKINFRFSEKMQMLAFGYASIYSEFMGNLTMHKTDQLRNPAFKYFTYYFERIATVNDAQFDYYDTALSVKNVFGMLHFVSCGSRGIEPFPFQEFVSVFELKVWIFMGVTVSIVSGTVTWLYKKGCGLVTFFFYKVLVEQGDPFPANFDKSRSMRYIMVGIFLAGVVISNAFKSENVYKIVMPRSRIPYTNIDEIMEDNVTLYTRINMFTYKYRTGGKCSVYNYILQEGLYICREPNFSLLASAEHYTEETIGTEISPDSGKIRNYSRIHPKALKSIIDPVEYLGDLVNVGIIDNVNARKIEDGNSLANRFNGIQEKLIKESLNNCSKTAWILPNYLAQIFHRLLRKSGKHSDISSSAYNLPYIRFTYVPSSILRTISLVQSTGLLEWWPKFINRSDLVLGSENVIPTKPSMTGNILVIFVFLGTGLSTGLLCILLETRRNIFSLFKFGYKFFALKLQNVKKLIKKTFS